MRIDLQRPINWKNPLNRGLISWWMVLPHWRGGLTWRDLCGRNHGTLTNMDPPTDWVGPRGRPGGWGALDFDGSNDHVLVAHSNSFNVSSLSVAAWVRASVGGSTRLIVNRDGSIRQFQFRVEASNVVGWIVFTPSVVTISGTRNIADGAWHRVLATYSGVNGAMRAYVDGVQDASGTAGTVLASITRELEIGIYNGGILPWIGQIDDVRIWDRALSNNDVQADYNLSRRYYPGLLNRVRRTTFYSIPISPSIYRYTSTDIFRSSVITGR